jgi:succinoglycan biosynthesis transport protein ExoP
MTTHDELNEALGALQRAGITVIGAVINRSRS